MTRLYAVLFALIVTGVLPTAANAGGAPVRIGTRSARVKITPTSQPPHERLADVVVEAHARGGMDSVLRVGLIHPSGGVIRRLIVPMNQLPLTHTGDASKADATTAIFNVARSSRESKLWVLARDGWCAVLEDGQLRRESVFDDGMRATSVKATQYPDGRLEIGVRGGFGPGPVSGLDLFVHAESVRAALDLDLHDLATRAPGVPAPFGHLEGLLDRTEMDEATRLLAAGVDSVTWWQQSRLTYQPDSPGGLTFKLYVPLDAGTLRSWPKPPETGQLPVGDSTFELVGDPTESLLPE